MIAKTARHEFMLVSFVASGALMLLLVAVMRPTWTLPFLAVCATVVVGLAFPAALVVPALVWIMLVRPGAEVIHVQAGPVQLTEVELLTLVSVPLALLLIMREQSAVWRLDRRQLLLLSVWPVMAVLRALFPVAGSLSYPSSVLVDLRLVASFAMILPVYALLRTRGPTFLARLLLVTALLACIIAVSAWILRQVGVLSIGESALVHISPSSAADIRPGGEITVVFASLIVITMWSSLHRHLRVALAVLLPLELALSQTISMLLAIGAGLAFSALVIHRRGTLALRILTLLGLFVVVLLATGTIASGSRFDFTTRVDDSSSSYRVDEYNQFLPAVVETPATLLVGTGVGTSFVLETSPWLTEVKRDSHSVALAVTLKTGLLGLALFLAPWLFLVLRGVRSRHKWLPATAACIVALLVVSITVPWWWTFNGMAATLVLYCVGSAKRTSGMSVGAIPKNFPASALEVPAG